MACSGNSNCGCGACKGLVVQNNQNKVVLKDINPQITVKDDNKCTNVDVTAPTTKIVCVNHRAILFRV